MAKQLRLLDQVHIAAPCPANWDEMKGDDRVRHCSQCRLNVYNLSDMTDQEAETLLGNRQGRMCVRYFQREDGKVMTKNCAKGVRSLRQRAAKRLALAAAFVLTSLGCGEQGEKVKKAFGLNNFNKPPVVLAGALPMVNPPMMGSVAPSIKTTSGGKTVPMPSTKGKETKDPIAGQAKKSDT
jgi:hypothetical protein